MKCEGEGVVVEFIFLGDRSMGEDSVINRGEEYRREEQVW